MNDYSSSIEKLTDEIIESQKIRSDFMKWKIIVVAALGAAGLGLHGNCPIAPLLLLIIPFACFYIDTLCYHISLRISGIGHFFDLEYLDHKNDAPNFILKYERYLRGANHNRRPSYFRWEHIDAIVSSVLASTLIAAFPYIIKKLDLVNSDIVKSEVGSCCNLIIVMRIINDLSIKMNTYYWMAGIAGIFLCTLAFVLFKIECNRIKKLVLPN